MTIRNCPFCGGTHFGSIKCPFEEAPPSADVIPIKAKEPEPLRCPGVCRDGENDKALVFLLSRKVTDDEMRFLHEVMQRAVASVATAPR